MSRLSTCLLLAAIAAAPFTARAVNPEVRMSTPFGNIDLELCAELSTLCLGVAPNTVANFLTYVDSGAYDDSFVHRSVAGFVIQGGSFTADHVALPVDSVESIGNIASEFAGFSNVRGTVSVPLTSDPPSSQNPCDTDENSGSSGWFINLGPNNASLDCGLFTVFAVVKRGLNIADVINTRFRLNFGLGGSPVTSQYNCNPEPPSTACTTDPVPYLTYTTMTRLVPEPAAALQVLVAGGALAALARRRPS